MDFIRIIRSLEEFIYELATRIILIPKTFCKILLLPRWVHDFVVKEFSKDENERFDHYLSPIIIWMIMVVVPYVFIFNFLGNQFAQLTIQHQPTFFRFFFNQSLERKFFLLALILLIGSLGISAALLKSKRDVISKIKWNFLSDMKRIKINDI